MITKEDLLELQQILDEDYYCKIPLEKVEEIGNGLVGFYSLALEIKDKNKNEKFKPSSRQATIT